jgi:hypothetical protein
MAELSKEVLSRRGMAEKQRMEAAAEGHRSNEYEQYP